MSILLIAIGIGLRVWQYLANSSLWIDEAALARNIIDRRALDLFAGLDYAQVASIGFLLIEKAAVTLFGTSEYALRAFPLACAILSLFLYWSVAQRILTRWAVTFAVGLFALGSPFVYFASQVKQYSSDIASCLLIVSATLWSQSQPESMRRAIVLGIVGASTVWFSQPAFFVVAGAGISLTILAALTGGWPRFRTLGLVGTIWGLSASAAALLALERVSAMDRQYLNWYWAGGFWPFPPRTVAQIFWPWDQLTWAFGRFLNGPRRTNGGLNYPWSPVFVVVMFAGYIALWRRRRDAALLLLLPAAVTLIASALHMYPFTGRLLVFVLPSFLLATAAGAEFLLVAWPPRFKAATVVLLAVLGGAPIYAAATAMPPERIEHIRPIAAGLAARIRSDDAVYVYYGAGQAFSYYAPRFGLTRPNLTIGRCSQARPRAYLRELDRFRGRPRVWVVATHVSGWNDELRILDGYLQVIGHRLDSMVIPATTHVPTQAAYGFLYDLSDPVRLRASSSDTFPVPVVALDDSLAQWRCYGTQRPVE